MTKDIAIAIAVAAGLVGAIIAWKVTPTLFTSDLERFSKSGWELFSKRVMSTLGTFVVVLYLVGGWLDSSGQGSAATLDVEATKPQVSTMESSVVSTTVQMDAASQAGSPEPSASEAPSMPAPLATTQQETAASSHSSPPVSEVLAGVTTAQSSATIALPSFSCGGRLSEVEQMICAEPQLARLDADLALEFARAKSASSEGNRLTLVSSQRDWIKLVRNGCQDAACLKAAYQERIDAIKVH